MAKMFSYMVITVTVWLFLSILGITISGSFVSSKLGLTDVDSLANIEGSLFWIAIVAGFATLGVAGLVMGLLGRTFSAIPATAALATGFFVFMIGDIVLLVQQAPEPWMKTVLWLIVAPWTAGFIITAWDWTRGVI